MTIRTIAAAATLASALALAPARALAQEFVPPDRRPSGPPAAAPAPPPEAQAAATTGVKIDLLGFSSRVGGQINKDQQVVLGSTFDLAQLYSPQVRLRPSFEVGFGRPTTSLAINTEIVYRFQPDEAPAIPYLGLGVGYYDDNNTRKVWPTMVMGFELPFRRSINWLVEYHALDALRRSRFFVGLATRNGGR